MPQHISRTPHIALLLVPLTLAACASNDRPREPDPFAGLDRADRSVAADERPRRGRNTQEDTRPAAVLDGDPVTWDQLKPHLLEAAGRIALEEVALDRLLAKAIDRRNETISEGDIEAERRALLRTLRNEAEENPDESASQLLHQLWRSRGMGPTRRQAALERNAKLRRLVKDDVNIEDDDVRTAYEIRHGTRYRVRLILAPTEREATSLRRRLVEAEGDPVARFAELAVRHSQDTSASRGGMIDPISPADASYPTAVRRVLPDLREGRPGPILATDAGYAILLLEEVIEPDGTTFEEVEPELRQLLRRRAERQAMDRLARELLEEARLTIFDRSLEWSWQSRPRPGRAR